MRRNNREKDEDVLDPLMESQRTQPHRRPRLRGMKLIGQAAGLFEPPREPCRRIDGDDFPALAPDLPIGGGVAGIIEHPSEPFMEQYRFVAALQIERTVAREYFFENTQMRGHAARQNLVRRRSQYQAAATSPLVYKPVKEWRIVGKVRDIQIDAGGQLSLQVRLALQQPRKHKHELLRMVADEGEQTFPKQIGAYERAIQIDAKRYRRRPQLRDVRRRHSDQIERRLNMLSGNRRMIHIIGRQKNGT